ncbi:uncharacterized protein L203_103173 [Cryptococcus depauperatus CBS 7841]|uniref:Uncharacterized protein n=1 Tax=Cryptococcus depauperatus CBS 7841 TaxID=1295531 RepID=A0A1E3IPC7_9TREE|nr:hypothetical protein L203_01551 [Cryptococcus depauperatus CBS 7841]
MSSVKQRHYSALASRMRALHLNLAETEVLLGQMALQLDATSKLGIHCGSQFMAVSRLLDKELQDLAASTEDQKVPENVEPVPKQSIAKQQSGKDA